MTLSRDRSVSLDLFCRAVGAKVPPTKLCNELPEGFHNRPEQLHLLVCFEPLANGRHDGPHHNRAGDAWEQKRRPRPIELVEERRHASW